MAMSFLLNINVSKLNETGNIAQSLFKKIAAHILSLKIKQDYVRFEMQFEGYANRTPKIKPCWPESWMWNQPEFNVMSDKKIQ